MDYWKKKVAFASCLILVGAVVCVAVETKTQPKTLLTMLSEWQYPKSEFHGAQMSDGGMEGIVSSHCKAVLTTKDSFEKVTAFYAEKLKLEEREKNVNKNTQKRCR